MSSFHMEKEGDDILRVGFGEPAGNDRIVQDASEAITGLLRSGALHGGKLLKVNGPASMPVAMLMGHCFAHLYETVACYDPKLGAYVVIASHGGPHLLGELLE